MQHLSLYIRVLHDLVQKKKKNGKKKFSKKSHFLKNESRFKVKNKKIMKSTQCIEQVGVRLRKKIL